MSKIPVLQPNGKLAVWSTVCDDFVMLDATVEDVVADLSDVLSIVNHVRDVATGRRVPRAFIECVETVKAIHGRDAESLQILGISEPKAEGSE